VLAPRSEIILKSIIDWYILKATPVSSGVLVHDYDLKVSSATVRNEMAFLEQEGYIVRPHTSAGSIPSDKGYRFYVAGLPEIVLPESEQRMIKHLFHQVEGKLDEWLSLAAAVTAQLSQNTAVITAPKPADCQFRHMEVVSIQDTMALLVLVLRGARIKQQMLTFESAVSQSELSALSTRMNEAYSGLSARQLKDKGLNATALEKLLTENILKIMEDEDNQEFNQSYLEGLHYLLNQPEFSHNQKILAILELLEHRSMLSSILPADSVPAENVRVVIGSENKSEIAQECSLVIGRYGLPAEASGSIVVVGPTRMAYARIIATITYLSELLSGLVAELYGIDNPNLPKPDSDSSRKN
jgi:heat-inducible transcriptional repressor